VQIIPYSEAALSETLANKYTPPEVIVAKNHYKYLIEYLGVNGLKAETIVIEENYISKDFLHDYVSYYALCFERYPKFCKRVHFFSCSFSEEQFSTIILGKESETQDLWNTYLGFIVVKPIPVTVIGYSVLKTYSQSQSFDSRNFWGVRNYKVHFYGKEIELQSLAFQEQDSVLSACATTAIWAMLNKASVDFHTILKSPSQITKDADNLSHDGSRLFPNKGLNLLQICQAILNSGLVSEIKQDNYLLKNANGETTAKIVSNKYLKKILNAYSSIGIPVILVVNVPNGEYYGLHAITISGYKQKSPNAIPPQPETSWLSNNIEKIYAHDDQWGPFARIDFQNEAELITPWTLLLANGSPTYVTNIVVPLYPKIRISYENIEAIVLGLDTILSLFLGEQLIADLVWDIKIQFSEDYKFSIKNSTLDSSEKLNRLTKSLPKYIWDATCYIGENKVFEFTFDATDVNSGMIGEDFICYLTTDVKPILSEFLSSNRSLLQPLFNLSSKSLYYDFLIQQLSI
jgi:hypothetical protein